VVKHQQTAYIWKWITNNRAGMTDRLSTEQGW